MTNQVQFTESETTSLPLMVPVIEAVRLTGISRSELYRRMAAGQIQARKSGKRTLIPTASLASHLASLPAARFRAPKTAS